MFNLFKSLNATGPDLEFTSKQFVLDQIVSSGAYMFELSTFELEAQKYDWGSLLFAAALGVVSIYTGLWMINMYGTTSIFAASFGTSLIMQGVGDMIQSLISVGTGNSIDFSDYINAKGMSTAISLATAGFLQFANMIPVIQNLGFIQAGADKMFNAAQDPTKLLATIGAIQGTTMAASIALQKVGENFVDPEHIEAKAGAVMGKL